MPDTNVILQQAIAAARAGNTAEARELVDGLVEDHPDNPHALFLRGMLAESQEEQVQYLRLVLEIDPEHEAANRRLAQLSPAEQTAPSADAEEATAATAAEPEEILESEPASVTGVAETFIGAAVVAEVDESEVMVEEEPAEDQGEWGVAETVVTAAAVGAGLEAIDDDTTMVDPDLSEALFVDDQPDELEEPADDLDDTLMTAGLVTGAALATEQDDEIPEWLMGDTPAEEEPAVASSEDSWAEAPAEEVQELPDWLTEQPSEEWAEPEADATALYVADEPDDTVFDDSWTAEEASQPDLAEDELVDEAYLADDAEPAEEVPDEDVDEEKPKKKSANRGLEIALFVLMAVALLIVIGLFYVIIFQPL